MKSGELPRGYTVVEVMIFLAITGALFVMIAIAWSGRQAKTDFSVSVREMESRLQDIINDVSTGYYANPGGFRCTVAAGVPTFSAISTEQGKNDDCIFMGRVAHFVVSGAAGASYNVYTVAGARQYTASGIRRDVTNLAQARPRLVLSPVDITERPDTPSALRIANMYYDNGSGKQAINAVGFYGTLATYNSQGLQPGTMKVNVIPITSANSGQTSVSSAVNGMTDAYYTANQNPSNGVVICMNGAGTAAGVKQHAELKIGGGGRQLTTDVSIKNGACPSV